MSSEHLPTPVSFFNIFHLPAVRYMDFGIKHTVHHRRQLGTCVQTMNVHVPGIYGGSAVEPFRNARHRLIPAGPSAEPRHAPPALVES